jgi:serine/threonine protein kinase
VVALKIQESQCKTEYDTLKLVREIQLMRRMNSLSTLFITHLIDIITPELGGIESKNTQATQDSFSAQPKSLNMDSDHVSLCMVLDYLDTDLDKILKRRVEFKEKHVIKITYNLLLSLAFIHKCNVVHRDLKCANILVSAQCNVKICDLGLSRSMPQSTMDKLSENTLRIRNRVGPKLDRLISSLQV